MGFFNWFKKAAPAPSKLTARTPVVATRPLWEQFCRIGGGLTPQQVTQIVRRADSGYPAELVDLANESRQKDGHLQGILSARDAAVAACPLDFVIPERLNQRKSRKDKKAVELCRRVVDEFDNWPVLIEHLTGAYLTGHATSQIYWQKTKDGFVLPYRAEAISPRQFVFSQSDGQLRYSPRIGVEVDLLADNPGRIIQVQRRIVGDVPCREGLLRLIVWAALFRNWSLRDWISLGEVSWKPWRIGIYEKAASDEDIEALEDALEHVGSNGTAALPETTKLQVEWPKGMAPGTGGSSTHRELFDTIGREMSKAVLGTTTSIEAGPNGTRSDTTTRDGMRIEKREQDAVAVAAALKAHLFNWVVKINLGEDVVVPTPWFQTDESLDQETFAGAIEKLTRAKVRIPAKWVRDEIGMPEPREGEEIVGEPLPGTEPEEEPPTDDDAAEDSESDDTED